MTFEVATERFGCRERDEFCRDFDRVEGFDGKLNRFVDELLVPASSTSSQEVSFSTGGLRGIVGGFLPVLCGSR